MAEEEKLNEQNQAEDDNPTLTPLKIWKFYQQNIRISEQAQSDILRGVKAGADLDSLLRLAVRTIGALVNDSAFPSLVEKELDKRKENKEA